MRSTICISAGLLFAGQAALAQLPGPQACYQRSYDAAHLAARPQQGVAALRLWFFDAEAGRPDSRRVIVAAEMADQGQGARDGVGGMSLRATMDCAEDDALGPACFVDCDGGYIALERREDGGLVISTDHAVLGQPETCGGFSDLSEGGPTGYLLAAAPLSACADLALSHPLPDPGCYGVAYSRADAAGTVAAMTLHLALPDPAFARLSFPWLQGQLAIDVAPGAPGMDELAGARVILPVWCAADNGLCQTLHPEDGHWAITLDGADVVLTSGFFLLFDDLDAGADLTRGMRMRHALTPLPAEACAALVPY